MAARYRQGIRVLTSILTASSDSAGHYYFDGLVPGRYFVFFQPGSGRINNTGIGLLAGFAPSGNPQPEVPVELYAGTSVTLPDVVLRSGAQHSIVGRVRGGTSGDTAVLSICPIFDDGQFGPVVLQSVASAPEYRFRFDNIREGRYLLFAESLKMAGRIIASASVTVHEEAVANLELTLGTGATVHGTVATPTGDSGTAFKYDALTVRLDNLDLGFTVSDRVRVQRDGTFAIDGVPPGRLQVGLRGLPPMMSLDAVSEGGIPCPHSVLRVDEEQTDVEIHISLRPVSGRISGFIRDKGGKPLQAATVLLQPVSETSPEPFRVVHTDGAGAYLINGIGPGDYLLYAWATVARDYLESAEFLASQVSSAAKVRVDSQSVVKDMVVATLPK